MSTSHTGLQVIRSMDKFHDDLARALLFKYEDIFLSLVNT
uniref:Uncharacterized protein n=1 Tax=Arundo donax TaxID=35708 RepID=A0A0A9B287_ARUDO